MNVLKEGVRGLVDEEAEILWKNVRPDLETNGIRSKRALKKRLFNTIYPYAKEVLASDRNFTPLVTRFAIDYIDNELLKGKEYSLSEVKKNG